MKKFIETWPPRILSILRIVAGFLFLWHGSQKLFGFPTAMPLAPGTEAPPFAFLAGVGGFEIIGGSLILLGMFTRPVAFVLSGMMAVAYFTVHAPEGGLPIANGGELAVIYCFVFLYLFFAGGGEWSIDKLIQGKDWLPKD